MKKLKYFVLPLLFLMTMSSCYIYKPYAEKFDEEGNPVATINKGDSRTASLTGVEKSPPKKERERPLSDEDKAKIRQDAINSGKEPAVNELGIGKQSEDEGSLATKAPTKGNRVGQPGSTEVESSGKNIGEPKSESKVVLGIQDKILPNHYYKITVDDNQYKIQADQWESDTLVSHILRKPEKVLKFHKDQINEDALLERRFSKPFSDLFTIGSYVVAGTAVLLLVL